MTVSATYRRRRSLALGVMLSGVVCSAVGLVEAWGWADLPGGTFLGLVMGPMLVVSGSFLHSSARHAEGEARREEHRRSSR